MVCLKATPTGDGKMKMDRKTAEVMSPEYAEFIARGRGNLTVGCYAVAAAVGLHPKAISGRYLGNLEFDDLQEHDTNEAAVDFCVMKTMAAARSWVA
jgi:hypothetical protein